jgi:hypothetical protein
VPRYDNTLRLYDAPLHWSQPQPQPQPPLATAAAGATAERAAAPSGAEAAAGGALECLHRLAGHKNRHWPIKSSIFVGHDYVRGAALRRWAEGGAAFDGPDEREPVHVPSTVHETAVVATGSTDHHAYVFDIGVSLSPSPSPQP